MKKIQTPLSRSGGCSRTGRWFNRALATTALLCAAVSSQAQISVGVGGAPADPFTTTPTVGSWATLTAGVGAAGAGTYTTPATVEAGAQTVNQSTINLALPTTAADGTSANGRHNTAGTYLVTQPTAVAAAVLKATLRNNSGGVIASITVAYDFSAPVAGPSETAPGHRAFYSLTGLPNSWTLIPEFSGLTAAASVSAVLNTGVWAGGTDIYLLWLDDNAGTNPDGGYAIDNFAVNNVVPGNLIAINITNQPASLTVNERSPASFTVGAGGSPQAFHWNSNGVPIIGANSATYSIASAPYSANGAVFTCIVSNSLGAQTSAGATLTVNADTNAPTAVSASASTNGTDIVLTFSEAMNPGYADTSAFLVYETGTDYTAGNPPISAVVNGNTITLTMGAALTDGVNYSVYLSDVYDTSLGVAEPGNLLNPNPTFIPIRRDLLLIDFDGPNNIWSWTAETNLFGTGWENVGYDDSLWPTGPGALGVNTDANPNTVPIRTATAYPTPGNSAPQFFRRHFFLPSGVTGTTLSIRHLFEDGAVVFINGQEAGRFNVATGVLSVATRAIANFVENSPLPAPVALNTAGLVAGDNVIAVVVFQNGGTSSDSIMALELVAGISTFAAGPPSIVTQPAAQSVAEGANVSFSVVADGALPLTYQWSRNATPILNATNASYSIVGVLPSQAGNYRVQIVNGLGSTNSTIAVLGVTADGTPPAFVSAIGDVTLTNITLTIYDAFGLNIAAANNAANYTVTPTGGGAAVTVLTAALSGNGSNVVLTTTPRTVQQNYNLTLSSNIRDRSEAANLTTPFNRPVVATIVIMSYNKVWKYDESGNNLGGTWSNVGYDDSLWPSGAGFLAFENTLAPLTLFTNLAGGNGTNTSLNLTNATLGGIGGTNITFYFRTTLNGLSFDPTAPGNTIRSTSYFDDGGVIYVNGGEQLRFNLTNSPVALNYTNLAVAGSTEGAGGLITSNLTGFVQANNVIAAEVHQNTLNSSDIAWGMQLEALVTTFSAGCPTVKIVDNSNGTVTLSWTGAATLQETTALQTPSASTVWVNSARVNGTPFTPSGIRFYRLSCP